MSAFKRHLAAAENPDLINAVSLFEDIELFLNFGDGVINRPKKDMQATLISKFVVSIQFIVQIVQLLACWTANPKVGGSRQKLFRDFWSTCAKPLTNLTIKWEHWP